MRKYILLLLLIIPFKVYAEDASNISKNVTYKYQNQVTTKLNDDNVKTNIKISANNDLVITSSESNIKHIYIIYEISSKNGVLTTNNNEEKSLGKDGFLHEYIKLDNISNEVKLKYNEDTTISEIRVYTDGDIPSDVQIWKKENSADLMIFSTHADDEQLFFAGVMPTYINNGKKVHVVYFARHDVGAYYAPSRLHEQLDGLWTLGVTDYPTFGIIPDAYSESIDVARSQMNNAGFTDDDVIKFDVREIRKYKPKVVLGHDEAGEYGHGQHRLNIYTLKEAINKSEDSSYVVDDLEAYSVDKFYIHLYNYGNDTVLNYDEPLDKYNGKTAYEVSKEGYKKHLSQQYTWFTDWLNGKNNSYTSATQITKYNPAHWGLYKSNVGEDVNKNDLFENIKVEEVKQDKPKEDKKVIVKKDSKNNKEKKSIKECIKDLYKKNKYIVIVSISIIGLLVIFILFKRKK